jgi:hypothetical protein
MPRSPVEPPSTAELPVPPVPPPALETPSADGSSEGMLDLDEEGQINNQHLEVR